jgi:hypothetical protein
MLIHNRPNAKDVARKALAESAGTGFLDCGWSAIGHDRSIQRDCVFNAYQSRKPFIALYEVSGKEEPGEVGVAGDKNGGAYMITIESGGNFHELYAQFLKDGRHLTATPCPAPPKLEVIGDGYILCSWK